MKKIKSSQKEKYRVEWMHNFNWRFADNNDLNFPTINEAEKAKNEMENKGMRCRIVAL